MSVPSDSIAAKAEARRKKILENAQKRMDKVQEMKELLREFSLEKDNVAKENKVCQSECSTIPETETNSNRNELKSNKEIIPLKQNELQNGSMNLRKVQKKNHLPQESISKSTFTSNGFKNGDLLIDHSTTSQKTQVPENFDFSNNLKFLENLPQAPPSEPSKECHKNLPTHIYYVTLAIVVRLLFHLQCGWIFGQTMLVPFFLSESVQISLGKVHKSPLVQNLSQVLTLCNLPSHVILTYARVNTILIHCVEDFSIYFVTFCVFHSLLEEEVQSS